MRRVRSSLASLLITMVLGPHAAPLMVWFDSIACVCVKATCCCPARPAATGTGSWDCHRGLGGVDAAVRCGHAEQAAVVRYAPALVPQPIALVSRSSVRMVFHRNAWSPSAGFQRIEAPPPRASFLSA